MQSLAIISVNLWQILISIANLIILFLLVKKFLFRPVQKMLADRQAALNKLYSDADNAKETALLSEQEWKKKLDGADSEAEAIIQKATDTASWRSDKMIEEAKEKADGIIRQAETAADLYRKQATDDIKQEIVNVSAALTEKLLEREINMDDHKNLIDAAIEQIGDDND